MFAALGISLPVADREVVVDDIRRPESDQRRRRGDAGPHLEPMVVGVLATGGALGALELSSEPEPRQRAERRRA